MSQPPDTWASEMQALQDQIEQLQLDLECARRNEAAATYWQGQADAVQGVASRWEEALTCPIPKAGVMQQPLEGLYRRTEQLRLENIALQGAVDYYNQLAAARGEPILVRG